MFTNRVTDTSSILAVLPNITDRAVFPGALPAGLRRISLNYIFDPLYLKNYVVTAKLDGVRVLLILIDDSIFLMDRAMGVYQIYLSDTYVQDRYCVFDCELMDDTYILVFDAMIMEGTDIHQLPFSERYSKMCTFLQTNRALTKLHIVPKRMHPCSDVGHLLQLLTPRSVFDFFDGCHVRRTSPVDVYCRWSYFYQCPRYLSIQDNIRPLEMEAYTNI